MTTPPDGQGGQDPGQYGQQPYGQMPPPPPGALPYAQPQSTSGMAIASLVLAFFCSIAGLITGIVALNQISSNPQQKGRGLAIAGIVISVFGMVLGVIVLAKRN